jgi:hypothetical protein
MQPAKLGGVSGAAQVRSRRRSNSAVEYRGTFVSTREHDGTLSGFLETREKVEFQGVIDGERATLRVIVTDVSPITGMVFFHVVPGQSS